MKLVSVNTGLPRETAWQGGTVTTGIFKKPLSGRVKVRRLNLDGDRQADLSVHGGPSKTAYAYPSEHYPYWRGEFPDIAALGNPRTGTAALDAHTDASRVCAFPFLPCFLNARNEFAASPE